MSTNYYYLVQEYGQYTEGKHIGKRCAAGKWCMKCDRTMSSGGISRIHHGDAHYKTCPQCLSDAYLEGVCSFLWADVPIDALRFLEQNLERTCVINNYSDTITGFQMLDVISGCKVHYIHSVGEDFS